jgi:hypothetical protein
MIKLPLKSTPTTIKSIEIDDNPALLPFHTPEEKIVRPPLKPQPIIKKETKPQAQQQNQTQNQKKRCTTRYPNNFTSCGLLKPVDEFALKRGKQLLKPPLQNSPNDYQIRCLTCCYGHLVEKQKDMTLESKITPFVDRAWDASKARGALDETIEVEVVMKQYLKQNKRCANPKCRVLLTFYPSNENARRTTEDKIKYGVSVGESPNLYTTDIFSINKVDGISGNAYLSKNKAIKQNFNILCRSCNAAFGQDDLCNMKTELLYQQALEVEKINKRCK